MVVVFSVDSGQWMTGDGPGRQWSEIQSEETVRKRDGTRTMAGPLRFPPPNPPAFVNLLRWSGVPLDSCFATHAVRAESYSDATAKGNEGNIWKSDTRTARSWRRPETSVGQQKDYGKKNSTGRRNWPPLVSGRQSQKETVRGRKIKFMLRCSDFSQASATGWHGNESPAVRDQPPSTSYPQNALQNPITRRWTSG